MAQAMDMLEGSDGVAGAVCADSWLETYGMDVDAEVTDVVGTLALG